MTRLPVSEAQHLLQELAGVFSAFPPNGAPGNEPAPSAEARYRALVEQIPAVVFMADLEQGAGEAYVSPQIEDALGFTQAEWLEDPVRWYEQVHPADKERWSLEAADMVLTGRPLRSCYRVLARDGRVVWFQCEVRMVRGAHGEPCFLHGIGVDITELKRAQEELQEERNVASAILDAVGTLVIVLDPQMRIVRFNRVCEQTSGQSFDDVRSRFLWDLFPLPEQAQRFRSALERLRAEQPAPDFETQWGGRDGEPRLVSWAITVLRGADNAIQYFIATGNDMTARKRLESALLEISSREQRRIGQDLHDGLGQLLTGIAFMSKAHEQNLAEKSIPEASDAAKIVRLVNDAIRTARELSRGLMPISPEPGGLMTSLEQLARDVEDMFGIACRFECGFPVFVHNADAASHLYHIAQEAIHNGVKHGKARRIEVSLSAQNGQGSLVIRDSGRGIQHEPGEGTGMGLQIMAHRAKMIGGSLEVVSDGRGTAVVCEFPAE